jgi:hypothetical protein
MRHKFDDDTIDTTHYGPCKLEALHSEDMHYLSMNMLSVEDYTFIYWWMKRRLKKNITRRKHWVLVF